MSEGAPGARSKLYSPRLLALSADLANFPFSADLPLTSEAKSRTCGSSIKVGLELGDTGTISRIGMRVTACAVGQSSAAILARSALSSTPREIATTLSAIEDWLDGAAAIPEWPEFDALSSVIAHRGRYGAVMLPWKAATQALSTASTAG